jgi:phage terminase small subunit
MPGNAASKARKTGKKPRTPGSKLAKGPDGLNDKQRRFALEFIVDLNGTQAAIRAGYSEKTARAIAQELVTKAEVVAAIQAAMDERAKRTNVTADRVILEAARIGFSDLRKLFAVDGSLLPVDQWPDDVAAAVASVEVDELFEGRGEERTQIGFTRKVKMWDKVKSLDLLGRHLKLWVERHEHTGPNGGPIATRNDGIDLKNLTDAELEQLETIVKAAEQRSAGR